MDAATKETMKILIVDDEPIVRRALDRALSRAGHTIITAEEGVSGLEMWNSANPDVVLLDVLMPGLTGPQVLQKKEQWECCVIMMSAYTGEEALDFQTKFPIQLFLSKPFENIFDIVKTIETTARGHLEKAAR
jgi:CheY-like chemotaxis protein